MVGRLLIALVATRVPLEREASTNTLLLQFYTGEGEKMWLVDMTGG